MRYYDRYGEASIAVLVGQGKSNKEIKRVARQSGMMAQACVINSIRQNAGLKKRDTLWIITMFMAFAAAVIYGAYWLQGIVINW